MNHDQNAAISKYKRYSKVGDLLEYIPINYEIILLWFNLILSQESQIYFLEKRNEGHIIHYFFGCKRILILILSKHFYIT